MILAICPLGVCGTISILDYYKLSPTEIRIIKFQKRDHVSIEERLEIYDSKKGQKIIKGEWSSIRTSTFCFESANYGNNVDLVKRHKAKVDEFSKFMEGVDGIIYLVPEDKAAYTFPDKIIEKFSWENKIPSIRLIVQTITRISDNYPTEYKTESRCKFTYEEGRHEWDLESLTTNLYEFKELQFYRTYFELEIKYHNLGCINSDNLTIRALNFPWIQKNVPKELLDETNIVISFIWRSDKYIGEIYKTPRYPLMQCDDVKTLREMFEYLKSFNDFWEEAHRNDIRYLKSLSKSFPSRELHKGKSLFFRW